MENKKTKRDFYNELMVLATTDEQKKFIAHELELLDKKHGNKKPTKAQEENGVLKAIIYNTLAKSDKAMIVGDLQKAEGLEGLSNQKVSALVKQLIDSGLVVREEIKKVAYFSAVIEEDETEEEEETSEESEEEVTE